MADSDCEIIGIDEVGRGCLAGPMLVVAARQCKAVDIKLEDSKKLSSAQRESLYKILIKNFEFGDGWVSVAEINRLGLTKATRLGVRRALKRLGADEDATIIIDGHINYAAKKFRRAIPVIDADAHIPIVSAASIYAKVTRDRYMRQIAATFPGYDFENNVGYATASHIAALSSLGPISNFHRLNYQPVRMLLEPL